MSERIKILFVRPHMAKGGADQVTLMLLRHLDRKRYEPSLALMRAEGPLMEDVPKDVVVHNCNARSLWFMVTPLLKILRHTRYDVIYSTCGGASMPLSLAYRLLPNEYKSTLIVSERNILLPLYKGYFKRHLMLRLKKVLYRQANFVTAVSKGVADEVRDLLKVDSSRIKVVNNPVIDDKLYAMADEHIHHQWLNKDYFTFVAVGRLVEQKDYPTMLEAFKIAKKECQNLKLIVLGDGHLKSSLHKLTQELGLAEDVDFMGYQKNPYPFMKAASAFILSSKHEGMPGVLVQALAINGHCISTDCPTGPNELIVNDINGILVPVEEVTSLSKAIIKLYFDVSFRDHIKHHAKDKIGRFEAVPALESYLNFIEN